MPGQPSQKEYWGGKVGDEWAAYAKQIDIMLAPIAEAALERAKFQPGERVLDIGCGAGGTSLEIARRVGPGGSVVGVDLSPQLLTVARQRGGAMPVEFIEADAARVQFDQPFDAAFSRFGVMFFEEPAPAFHHIRSLMRPAARMNFACWRGIEENGWATTPLDALRPMLLAPLTPPDPNAPGPFAFADRDKIVRILSEAGWRNADVARWDGDIPIGGGGEVSAIAEFLLRIGPCARAIADQALDMDEARKRLEAHLKPLHRDGGVALTAACWLVSADA